MTVEEIRGLMLLTILPMMAVEVVVVVMSWVACRHGFGNYLQASHPEKWNELVSPSEVVRAIALTTDVTSEVKKFRKADTDDLGDLELRTRRERANRLERRAIRGFLFLGGWMLLVMAGLVLVG